MSKRFLIAWVVVFVLWMLGDFVVHGVLLHDDYMKLTNLFRSEADSSQYFGWMILAHVVMAGAFAWIYSRGVEASPWAGQGIRYGIAIALLTAVPTYVIYYVVQPMPAGTAVRQIVFESILTIVLGLVVAFVYKSEPAKA